ncbi:hypothetical protein [Leminorella grimontii]|uniref:hypothetical protein n=1 Tax=Leminorella grimontii TaxID=82981 RepID=UPI00321FA498
MNAKEFNKRYSIGHMFVYESQSLSDGAKIVKMVAQAVDSKGGPVVEINRIPYFVRCEKLKSVN